jgi:uncharacterized protein (TIGR03435 family)
MKSLYIAAVYTVLIARAQNLPPDKDTTPTFDAVSIKKVERVQVTIRANGGAVRVTGGLQYTPGRLTCGSLPLRSLVREAYSVNDWQVSGPSWIDSEVYQLVATMPQETARPTARLMLRTMLAERFKLALHTEEKVIPVYALVQAEGGIKLRQAASTGTYSQKVGGGKFVASGMPLAGFAHFLTSVVERPVIDMVNSPSVYDFELEWTPDYEINPDGARRDRGILGVLERQAGLKLEPRKSPVQILVIDQAERIPTEN